MKKLLTLISLQLLLLQVFAVSPMKTYFIDFGANDVTNGNSTIGPDENGNYWNNATVAKTTAPTLPLITSDNVATDGFMNVTADFLGTNGILNGGLLNPSVDLLDYFAIKTATQDFFYTDANAGVLSFGGLNSTKKYVFYLFNSRVNTENRTTQFSIAGANTFVGTLQSSGVDLGGTGVNANNSSILVSDAVVPTNDGKIVMTISKTAGTYAFVNCLKMEESDVTTSIENKTNKSLITVYNDPSSNVLTIKMAESEKGAVVKLFSCDGKLLYNKRTVLATDLLDLKALHVSGLVVVHVATAGGSERFKVIAK